MRILAIHLTTVALTIVFSLEGPQVSCQAVVAPGVPIYNTALANKKREDEDLGLLLALLMISGRNKNCNRCGCCRCCCPGLRRMHCQPHNGFGNNPDYFEDYESEEYSDGMFDDNSGASDSLSPSVNGGGLQ